MGRSMTASMTPIAKYHSSEDADEGIDPVQTARKSSVGVRVRSGKLNGFD